MPTLSIAMRVPCAARGPARRAGNRVCAALGTALRLAPRGAGIRRDPVNERYAATTPSRARRRLVESLTVLVATGHRLSAKRRIRRNREARPRGTSSFASPGGGRLARQRGLGRLESVAQEGVTRAFYAPSCTGSLGPFRTRVCGLRQANGIYVESRPEPSSSLRAPRRYSVCPAILNRCFGFNMPVTANVRISLKISSFLNRVPSRSIHERLDGEFVYAQLR